MRKRIKESSEEDFIILSIGENDQSHFGIHWRLALMCTGETHRKFLLENTSRQFTDDNFNSETMS